MMNNNRDDTRKQFNECLVKATDLLRLVSQQIGTNPTYGDLLDIMCLRSELDVLEDSLKEVLDRFQAPNRTYREVSALGRATEGAVDDALSLSEKFLRRITDVDGAFRSSKAACLEAAAAVMALVRQDTAISPTDAGRLVARRKTLEQAFARIEGSWENLLQSACDCDESVVFIAISELVEVTEDATDNALFKSEDLLRAIGHHGVTSEVHGMDLTHVVAKTRGAKDDDAYNPPGPRVNIAASDTDTYKTWDPAVPHRTARSGRAEREIGGSVERIESRKWTRKRTPGCEAPY
jgi:hypothetical protein